MADKKVRTYALIPARCGSQGIKNKNVKVFIDKPLLAHAITKAKECPLIDRVFLTTDSEDYMKIGEEYGAECPFKRPSEISGNASTDFEFIEHFCNWVKNDSGDVDMPDLIVQLRPTAPLVTTDLLTQTIQAFSDRLDDFDSLRTVIPRADKEYNKYWRDSDGNLVPIITDIPNWKDLPGEPHSVGRQFHRPLFFHNGYVDIVKPSTILEQKSVFGKRCFGFQMQEEAVYDINTPDDWKAAEHAYEMKLIKDQNVTNVDKKLSGTTQFIAEIGINHNGSMDLCKELILISKRCGCQYAKIQKRNPDVCVPEAQKKKPRRWNGKDMTYLEYKYEIEFSEEQIKELCDFAKQVGITFFASVWDCDSCEIMAKYTTIGKIGSALITNLELCKLAREKFETLIISTGMSTEEEVAACIEACKPDVVMHTNSTYPCPPHIINLHYIDHLKKKYPGVALGYSGHETGTNICMAAVAMGCTWLERHITTNRNLPGSDQSSSMEPKELKQLMAGIREIEAATLYPAGPRMLFDEEKAKRLTLRGN